MNKKIIIIEDELSLRSVLAEKLKSDGFEVLEAKNGQEGLEISISQKPDLILLDIVMPKMDGLTMLEKLREDSWGKKVPVIILTNLSSGAEMSRSAEGGVSGYLVKTDWKLDDVVKKIKETLK
ncbi:MAG: Transcriptional regulatory protein ResD [Candidatus Moranbacteria bacterium GW2011_GWF2_36_839]|nr:MAG: Transcriptional regulatory protein ResD [Candidatus Moranbacteria bacterium GW2011_GWF1_36_78]KKQ17443.1 MAG: Transcriptional regulatory protein ResD [Candidatus Moranbacteria bacterium GW2011_GWF2_36_839]HAT73910.1 response regulator [Candidatus Moranbacteria bacterium]HBY10564.1 response regulator [Candidatus Moranbacteria bacterium]